MSDSSPHAEAARRDPEFVRDLFTRISQRYDFANHFLSGGIDFLWRKAAARQLAIFAPKRVLDLACGSGDLWLAIRKCLPDAEIIGADFCQPLLDLAASKGCAPLVLADALALPFEEASFDAVAVGFGFRNMRDYRKAAIECARVLRAGGTLHILDFSTPTKPAVRMVYRFYLHKILPLLAGWATGETSAYKYLGGSIEQFPSGQAMENLLLESGFSEAKTKCLTFGIVGLYMARR